MRKRLTHNVQEHVGDEVSQLKQFLHKGRNVFVSQMSEMSRASIKLEIKLETEELVRTKFYRVDKAKEERNSVYASKFSQFLDLSEMF